MRQIEYSAGSAGSWLYGNIVAMVRGGGGGGSGSGGSGGGERM